MLFNIPLAIWVGFLALIALFVTVLIGLKKSFFKKNFFRHHKKFAFLTIVLVIIHLIFAILFWFFGIII